MRVTRLRKLRIDNGLSLATVARDNKLSESSISAYEILTRTPSLNVYRRLEHYYNCKEDLFEIVEIPDDTRLEMNTTTL